MRYLKKGLSRVPGWLHPFSAQTIVALSNIQRSEGLKGATGEIGVHHGKLFLLLHELADEGALSIAIDVFDDQHLNIDRSGKGDRQHFLDNLRRWSDRPEAVATVQASSLTLTSDDIVGKVGRLRLTSIDGGHTAECAESDVRLIESASEPHGVMVVDDYFNPMWPDVSVGIARYCLDPSTSFRPFAITPGKLYLARDRWRAHYREALEQRFPWRVAGHQIMFDQNVTILGLTHDSNIIKAALQRTPLFVLLKRMKQRRGR